MNKKKWIIASLIIYIANYVGITLFRIINTIEYAISNEAAKEYLWHSILYDLKSGLQFAAISWIMSMVCIVWMLLAKRLYEKFKTKMPVALSIFLLLLVYALTVGIWFALIEIIEVNAGFSLLLLGMAFYGKLLIYHLAFFGYLIVHKVTTKKKQTDHK